MKSKLLILVLSIAAIGGSFWLGTHSGRPSSYGVEGGGIVVEPTVVEAAVKERQPEFSTDLYEKDFYDHAYDSAVTYKVTGARSMVLPHHVLVASKIAGALEAIPDRESIETIVLLSPNHFSVGRSAAQTTIGIWKTPYGDLETDDELADELVGASESLKKEEFTFEREHGIGALTPFIKRSFPNAKLVPIILDESLPIGDARQLGDDVFQVANSKTLVIASIDMSHYLPEYTASYHDAVTELALEHGAFDGTLEVDANAVLQTLWAYNAANNSQAWHQIDRDSSVQLGATSKWRENTSHIFGYYGEGEAEDSAYVAIHFVGDIMLDRGVRKLTNQHGLDYPWLEMSRFLDGSHVVVGNLEGTVNELPSTDTYDPPFKFVFDPKSVEEMGKYIDLVSLANNHSSDVGSKGEMETQRRLHDLDIYWFGGYRHPETSFNTIINGLDLAFIGYHAFQPDEEKLKEVIERSKAEGRTVIVMPHWGTEYRFTPDGQETRLAKLMSDAGADLIIGGHPHVPQTIDSIAPDSLHSPHPLHSQVPVVYSLGNFIFDQEIPATWTALTVGAILTEKSIDLYLMPVYTKNSQPTPISDPDAEKFFKQHNLQAHYHFDL